jgi:hypothetical protein
MTLGKIGLGAVLAIALLGLSAVPALARPLAVDIYARPGDAGAAVEVTIPPDRTSATVPVQIFLGRKLPARRDPRFTLSTLVAREPATASLPSRPVMRVFVGSRDITRGGFHPRSRGTFAATLRFAGFDTFGTFEGDVLVSVGQAPMASRVHVVVRRYPPAEVAVGVEGPDEPLTATTMDGRVEVAVPIRNTTIGAADGVALLLGPVRAADGTTATVEPLGDPVPSTLSGLESVTRRLRVTMPAPGVYEGTVTVSWDGRVTRRPLRVEWVAPIVPPIDVTVLASQGARGDVPWCPAVLGSVAGPCATDALWLSLQETGGREVTLDAPTLRSLARRAAGREVAAPAVAMSASLECVAGAEDPDEASVGATASIGMPAVVDAAGIQRCARTAYDPAARRLTLGPGAIARLRLVFSGDLEPGEYVARVALASESTLLVDSEAALALRLPWIVALAAFLAGCVVAWPIRRPLAIAGRQMRQRARMVAIDLRLETAMRDAPDLESRAVGARTRATAERVLDAIRTRRHRGRQADRWLDDLEARADGMERWLAIWTDSARLSAAVQDRIRSRMVTVGRMLAQDERLSDLDRRTLEELESLGEQLAAVTAARSSPVRDPQRRRSTEPDLLAEWRWMVRDLVRHVRWGTVLESSTLLVLIVLAGLAFVWAPNPTWGSATDLAIAIGWSVGLVLVATAALTGLAAIRAQLSRPDVA